MMFQGNAAKLTPEDEQFLKAFRRANTIPHPAFRHVRVLVAWMVVAAGMLALLASGLLARRIVARAARYRDARQYKPGERDGSAWITFADGSPPVRAAGQPGPVIVRVASVTKPTFRTAQETIASEIIDGTAEALGARLITRATTVLWPTLAAVLFIALGAMVLNGLIGFLNSFDIS